MQTGAEWASNSTKWVDTKLVMKQMAWLLKQVAEVSIFPKNLKNKPTEQSTEVVKELVAFTNIWLLLTTHYF